MLKLICGPSGAGKTACLIQCIRHDIENQTKCFLLVPEQQAYISETEIPLHLPENAGLYFEIVNFSRLADDVFRACGGVTHTALNNGLISAIISFLRTLVFQAIAVLVLPEIIGEDGIWYSIAIAEVAAFVISFIFVIAYRKKYHYLPSGTNAES